MTAADDCNPRYRELLDAGGSKAADYAQQILSTTARFLDNPASQLDVLDLGCGYGHTARELARHCRQVSGWEPGAALYQRAAAMARTAALPNLEFRRAGIDDLTAREAYDLVVLDNVLEHLPDQPDALRRISEALRPGGAIYLLTPNKLWPIEAHYGLPFLSYVPLRIANAYLRLTGRGTDYTDASYAPTYSRLRRLLHGRPELRYEFVVPDDLSLTYEGAALHYRAGAALLRRVPAMWRFSKGFLVVAWKPRVNFL